MRALLRVPRCAASKSTRTFSDFESVADAMNGICQLYEQRLKQMNPGEPPRPRPTAPRLRGPQPRPLRGARAEGRLYACVC